MLSDDKWMQRALNLARRGQGSVHPNPMVGAVLVKDGRVVGEGFHRRYGQAHAEVEAFRKAGVAARGAMLYVTLEPCAHFGKTPPCARAVIDAGVTRVIAAMKDPNPKVAGRGFAALRRAGITVSTGVHEAQARELNRAFIVWVTEKRPFVTLKVAASLDGKTATIRGESQWITSPVSRRVGYELRREVDAIAVGVNTILKDDPELTAHGRGRDPRRIIFDSRLRTPVSARLLKTGEAVWIVTGATASPARRKLLTAKGVVLWNAPTPAGRLDLKSAMTLLAAHGITHLLVEGGATLAGSFLREKLVDEVAWFLAPIVIGDMKKLKDATRLKDVHASRLGNDIYIQGRVI